MASASAEAVLLDATTQSLLTKLAQISTRNSWSTLPSFVCKFNKKFPSNRTDARSLVAALKPIPPTILARQGVWTHSFGKKYMPLVLTNAAYRRAWSSAQKDNTNFIPRCSCGAKKYGLPSNNRC